MDKPKDFDSLHEPSFNKDYDQYMHSTRWQLIRAQRLKYDNYACCLCGAKEDLEVHHRTYENFGHESLNDLRTLCARCHSLVTSYGDQARKNDAEMRKMMYEAKRRWERQERERGLRLFVSLFKKYDVVFGGTENLCNLKTIYKYSSIFESITGSIAPGPMVIQEYFRNRKIEMILRFKEKGAEKQDLIKRGISINMVNKWWTREDVARSLLAEELLF